MPTPMAPETRAGNRSPPHRVQGDQQTHPEEGQPDDGVDGITGTLLDAEGRIHLVVQVGLQQAEA